MKAFKDFIENIVENEEGTRDIRINGHIVATYPTREEAGERLEELQNRQEEAYRHPYNRNIDREELKYQRGESNIIKATNSEEYLQDIGLSLGYSIGTYLYENYFRKDKDFFTFSPSYEKELSGWVDYLRNQDITFSKLGSNEKEKVLEVVINYQLGKYDKEPITDSSEVYSGKIIKFVKELKNRIIGDSNMRKESSTKDKYLLSVLIRKAKRVTLLERTAGEEPSKEDTKAYAKYILQNSEFLANEINDYLGKTGKNIEGIPDEVWAETAKELGFTKGSLVTEDGKLFHMKGKPVVYASKDTTSKKELEACDKTNKETKEEPKKKSEEKKATKEVIAEVQVTDSNGNALFEGDLVYTDDDYFGTIAEIKDKDTVVVSMGKYNSFLREYSPSSLTK